MYICIILSFNSQDCSLTGGIGTSVGSDLGIETAPFSKSITFYGNNPFSQGRPNPYISSKSR